MLKKKTKMEGAQQFFLIGLNYVDHFDYKVNFIIKLDVFKSYINTIYIDEISLKFSICYSRGQYKKNNMSIVVFYIWSWSDSSWCLKLLYSWSEEKKGTGEFWLNIYEIMVRSI